MQVLLLNFSYEVISFISIERSLSLYFKGKADIISEWNEEIYWPSGKMRLPATIRLRYYVRWIPKKVRFSRHAVFRRDNYLCQYCGQKVKPNKITIDHIIPKTMGGKNCFTNTVSACTDCNSKKADKTLEQAKMQLLSVPIVPDTNSMYRYFEIIKTKHDDWEQFFK